MLPHRVYHLTLVDVSCVLLSATVSGFSKVFTALFAATFLLTADQVCS